MTTGDPFDAIQRAPIEDLVRSYVEALLSQRTSIQVQTVGSDRRYTVEVIGVHQEANVVIVSAPTNPDKSLIAVHQDQVLICRWMNASTVFRFEARIARLVFEPAPMLHLNELRAIQYRMLRSVPRARAAIAASVRGAPVPIAALITDLSVSGARIGAHNAVTLILDQEVDLTLRANMFQKDFTLTIKGRVTRDFGEVDAAHPQIRFYGLTFTNLNDMEQLALHGIVQQQLALEADRLGQLLLDGARRDSGLTPILTGNPFPPIKPNR